MEKDFNQNNDNLGPTDTPYVNQAKPSSNQTTSTSTNVPRNLSRAPTYNAKDQTTPISTNADITTDKEFNQNNKYLGSTDSPHVNQTKASYSKTTSTPTSASRDSTSAPTHNLTLHSNGGDDISTNSTSPLTDRCTTNYPSELCNYSPGDPILPPAKTRVVIEGYNGSIITAIVLGYSSDGICHVLDKDSNTTFIIPENTCVRLPEEFYTLSGYNYRKYGTQE